MKQFLLAIVCVLQCGFILAQKHRAPKIAATALVNEASEHKTFNFIADSAQSGAILVKDTSLTIGFRDRLTKTVIIITLEGDNYVPAKGYFSLNDKGRPVCQGFIDLNAGSSADAFYGTGADTPQHVRPGNGTVTITAVTPAEVKGSFSMTLYNMAAKEIIVNKGEFDCAIAPQWKHPINKAHSTKTVSVSIHTQ
jgi:hypothetical protein